MIKPLLAPADSNDMYQRGKCRGFVLLWLCVALVVLMGVASLAVDFARVQVVKTQLRRATDAAARYGSTGLASGDALAWAQLAAADNTVNGLPFSLPPSDVQAGNWSSGTFTPGGTPANALRVSTALSAQRSSGISLLFGQIIGQRTCDAHASSTAVYINNPLCGIVGYTSVITENNTLFASYNSLTNTNPTANGANSNTVVGSNGTLDGGGNSTIKGNAYIGPSGTLSGYSVTGQQVS